MKQAVSHLKTEKFWAGQTAAFIKELEQESRALEEAFLRDTAGPGSDNFSKVHSMMKGATWISWFPNLYNSYIYY